MKIVVLIALLLTSSILWGQERPLLHVVEQIFRDSLEYNPKADTVVINQINGNNQSVLVRERSSINPATHPLVLVNGIMVEDISILGKVEMRDVKKIDVLADRTKSAALYGVRGIHGAVLITVRRRSEKRIRKLNAGG